MPPADAVRVEEFLNCFKDDCPAPTDGKPFSLTLDGPQPVRRQPHAVARRPAGQARFDLRAHAGAPDVPRRRVRLDGGPHRLPLAKRALRILVENLHDGDTVGLVTYAGNGREVLPPTDLSHKALIHQAIAELSAGGSTAMGDGLVLAYRQALRMVRPGHLSRVRVLTDGDTNVGLTSHEEILRTIAGDVKEGVTLSTLGFGMGNCRDDRGNGNCFYVDGVSQARRVFLEQLGGTLEVIAKDVKIQVEFDPRLVARYRLVGDGNRAIADKDFRDDKVDAGEIGAGHSVTAMYELELTGAPGAFATVRVRAKPPEGQVATELEQRLDTTVIPRAFPAAPPTSASPPRSWRAPRSCAAPPPPSAGTGPRSSRSVRPRSSGRSPSASSSST